MAHPPKTSVELLQAFLWTCPECGRDQFERSIIVELSPDEMQELRENHGVEPWESGHFCTKPDTVRCPHCNLDFATTNYGDDAADTD